MEHKWIIIEKRYLTLRNPTLDILFDEICKSNTDFQFGFSPTFEYIHVGANSQISMILGRQTAKISGLGVKTLFLWAVCGPF